MPPDYVTLDAQGYSVTRCWVTPNDGLTVQHLGTEGAKTVTLDRDQVTTLLDALPLPWLTQALARRGALGVPVPLSTQAVGNPFFALDDVVPLPTRTPAECAQAPCRFCRQPKAAHVLDADPPVCPYPSDYAPAEALTLDLDPDVPEHEPVVRCCPHDPNLHRTLPTSARQRPCLVLGCLCEDLVLDWGEAPQNPTHLCAAEGHTTLCGASLAGVPWTPVTEATTCPDCLTALHADGMGFAEEGDDMMQEAREELARLAPEAHGPACPDCQEAQATLHRIAQTRDGHDAPAALVPSKPTCRRCGEAGTHIHRAETDEAPEGRA